MTERSEILDKLKKLLRRGHSPYPAEAASALRKAKELADRHRIDLSSLELGEKEDEIIHKYFDIGSRCSLQRHIALDIVHGYFNVHVCLCKPRVVFVGREVDVAIAEYVHEFLVYSASRCLSEFKRSEKAARRKVTALKNRNFLYGFKYGIVTQLGQAEPLELTDADTTALVLQAEEDRRAAYMDQLFPNRKTCKDRKHRRNPTALMQGFIKGQDTHIRQGLDSQTQTPALEAQNND